jgi:hypothetical protein
LINVEQDARHESVRIEYLADHVDAIPALACWTLEEWGHSFADATFEELVSEFERRTIPHRIPETFVALEGDTIVGTASIVARDMSIRPEKQGYRHKAGPESYAGGRDTGPGQALPVHAR